MDAGFLSPPFTSIFSESLGPLLPSDRDSLLLLEEDSVCGKPNQLTGLMNDIMV